jgi:hypothetical protein
MESPFARVQAHLSGIRNEVDLFLKQRPGGTRKHELEKALGLRADRHGEQGGWLAWSILSLMINAGEVSYDKATKLYRKVG